MKKDLQWFEEGPKIGIHLKSQKVTLKKALNLKKNSP